MHILIVDDDGLMRAALKTYFESSLEGLRVSEAETAARASALLDTPGHPYDLLVVDVLLETPDAGWQLARTARARGVPVLLLSASRHPGAAALVANVPLVTKSELVSSDLRELVSCVLTAQSPQSPLSPE